MEQISRIPVCSNEIWTDADKWVNGEYKFRGTINKVIFDGYYKVFKEENEIKTGDFPELKAGDVYKIEKLNIEEGITKPPTRYSEATLVKSLKRKE